MGAFHCPLGSAYYEDEPCIDCGLCLATTEEEIGRASKKIEEFLRSQAESRKGNAQNSHKDADSRQKQRI